MKHVLMDPGFHDIVGGWSAHEAAETAALNGFANDNVAGDDDELSDPFLEAAIRMEVAATRLW